MAAGESNVSLDDENRRLLEQYTEIASLVGSLAHEIRNPLSTVNLNLQLLAEDFGEPQNQNERRALHKIEILQKECQRLEEILGEFLRFVRISDLELRPEDLNEIVAEMIDFHGPQAQVANIVIRDNLPESLPKVLLDRDMFKQALLNLMLNAHQAMPRGGELILQTHADDRFVHLDVIDTGIGMTSETLQKVFKPFYSTRPGGSGLGLPTAKRIIDAHHGKLTVESAPGKGTKFTIRLPIAKI